MNEWISDQRCPLQDRIYTAARNMKKKTKFFPGSLTTEQNRTTSSFLCPPWHAAQPRME